jgi:tetraacyldisaccharide 4'-kinase
LAPLGALFGRVAAARVALYHSGWLASARAAGVVVSVGNLSVGGSGKTPLVARIAELGCDAGLPVAVLSRGYRGAFRGEVLVVSDGERILADAAEAGDEAVMLARRLRKGAVVAVGRRRDRVVRAVESRFGPRLHVLDDGFQHLRLRRDLDLLCVDPEDLDDRPLPAGRLREAPAAAARADALFIVGAGAAGYDALRERWPLLRERPCFRLERRVTGFTDLAGQARPAPERPWLLSGIARPRRFAADVRTAGAQPLGESVFRDHHPFSAEELAEVGRRAEAAGADAVLTTAKDAVRLAGLPAASLFCVMETAAQLDDESWLRERLVALGRSRLEGVA